MTSGAHSRLIGSHSICKEISEGSGAASIQKSAEGDFASEANVRQRESLPQEPYILGLNDSLTRDNCRHFCGAHIKNFFSQGILRAILLDGAKLQYRLKIMKP